MQIHPGATAVIELLRRRLRWERRRPVRADVAYARYILRHKAYVLWASRLTGASLWRALVHDLSKLLPDEWTPYRDTFYAPDGSPCPYVETDAFRQAWLSHQHRNPHHWQYWLLTSDHGGVDALPMPIGYVREMIADWVGAGRAITGKVEVWDWYERNKGCMMFHPSTRLVVESELAELREKLEERHG